MCAGWDHLLPQWFTRLHPRYRTPVNSILFLGGITLAASIAVLIGVGAQEAFELLLIWAFTFYAIAYLALFAIPILAGKESSLRGPLWMKLLATFGFLMTLMYVVLSIFPIISVASQSAYSAKTVAVIFLANLAGLVLYYRRPKPA
jgi:amino acid transporter